MIASETPASGSVQTRDRLVDAARSLMTEKGSLGVSLVEIARRADANVALVSYHFKGREGLLIEVARSDAHYACEHLARLLASDLGPAEKLRRHIVALVQVYRERPYLIRLLHALMRDGSHDAAEQIAHFFVKPVADARHDIIRAGIASGAFRLVEAELIGFAIDGACAHIFWSAEARNAILGSSDMTAELSQRHAETMAALFVKGLAA